MSLALLNDKILPNTFNKGNSKYLECEVDFESSGEDHFQSTVVFVTAVVQEKGTIKIPLVVKLEPVQASLRELLQTNVQFYNEVLMYNQVLPLLNKNNIIEDTFGRFYHGVGIIGDPEKSVIVLQDLRPLGYKLTEQKVFIDREHFALAMTKLGRLHALSFAAKKESPVEFHKLSSSLKESSWTEGNYFICTVIACLHRAIDPLINKGKHVEVLQKLLKRIDANFLQFMHELVAPVETSAVICHGDFCRNNVFFKYDKERPVDVKFFDIATARYSSPAIDIVFFLFLNSSRNFRKAHWDDLLNVYYRALSTTVPMLEVPPLEDIRKEVLEKAIYGFVHCSFFLPVMLYETSLTELDIVSTMTPEEMAAQHALVGGEEGTRLLTDMVEELVDMGCLTQQNTLLRTV